MNRCIGLLATLLFVVAGSSVAEPTEVHVHALAHGAKFIGDGTGGAEITITDAATGDVLASGLTRGGTGSTQAIMGEEGGIHGTIVTADAASFDATLDIDTPTRVEVTARGPMAHPHALAEASATYTLIPGRHLTEGNGIMVTLPGIIIDVLSSRVRENGKTAYVLDAAYRVHMLCGCPVAPGGLWDADDLEMWIEAEMADGTRYTSPMSYGGQPKLFGAEVHLPTQNVMAVTAYVVDPVRANTGANTHPPGVAPED